ncbi:DUF6541 family protein [Amycolatopsis anabasis]|uniref:DUF6541 family protein n=1 Tax=Amycolatopsis anabasis TaxID=1840409 RepID=UPI001FE678AC|nr:DUF6541 family protein [Amycolatopsis anabasis]
MPLFVPAWSTAAVVGGFLLVLLGPGLLIGVAGGLRGWTLAGMAPLLSYAVAGISGPLLPMLGLGFTWATYGMSTALLAAAFAGARRLTVRFGRAEETPDKAWTPAGQLAVLGCLLLAAGTSGYAVLTGMGNLGAIPQGFDAPFHANGIRYLADTGDSGLFGMGSVTWFDGGSFYPNGYHLLAALAYQLCGVSVPAILNAHTVLVVGLLALSTVTLVRHFRGRAVLAGFSALTVVAATMVTYGTWSSPLLPFTLALALTPLVAVAGHRYLVRPAPDTGLLLAVAVVALLAIHSSALFGAVVFAVPVLVQRWWSARSWRVPGRDVLALLPVAAAGALLALPHLLGALKLAENFEYTGWKANYTLPRALGELLAFSHNSREPQLWLAVALLIGVVFAFRLGALRWLGGAAVAFGFLYVAVAVSDADWVMTLSRPWWDDRFRLVALAGLPMCVLAAHGLAELQRGLRRIARPLGRAAGAVAAVVVLAAFGLATQGGYFRANADYVALTWGNSTPRAEGMVVSPQEVQAMLELGRRARPGEWVLNEWFDGTAWSYAIGGVRPMAGHFENVGAPADTRFLLERFRFYDRDPAVRAALERRNVRWVLVTTGRIFGDTERPPGLTALDGLPFLERIYSNRDAVLFQLKG